MKAYTAIFRLRTRMELQYRGAMLGGILCQVFFGLILIALYQALYRSRPQTQPLSHVVTYVWLQQAFFRMLLASDPDLTDKIRSGGIAYDLCRPLDLYGFYYIRIMAQKLTGSLMRAVPMLTFAFFLPEAWRMELPASVPGLLLSLAALILGLLCVSALENITMAFTMRTLDPRGIQSMLNLLMMTLSGNILPLPLFPDSWQRVITLLPYAQLLDAPIRFYTGEYGMADVIRVFPVQAGWTLALTALGYVMWRRNERHMVLQGG
ncbi:MAG: ABC-2 family transporter protein [Butyrivibrio sp.]|nr:ABC-2 family transporter protein [Butyrivibrio sp.]